VIFTPRDFETCVERIEHFNYADVQRPDTRIEEYSKQDEVMYFTARIYSSSLSRYLVAKMEANANDEGTIITGYAGSSLSSLLWLIVGVAFLFLLYTLNIFVPSIGIEGTLPIFQYFLPYTGLFLLVFGLQHLLGIPYQKQMIEDICNVMDGRRVSNKKNKNG
jgi:hypothetical protein